MKRDTFCLWDVLHYDCCIFIIYIYIHTHCYIHHHDNYLVVLLSQTLSGYLHHSDPYIIINIINIINIIIIIIIITTTIIINSPSCSSLLSWHNTAPPPPRPVFSVCFLQTFQGATRWCNSMGHWNLTGLAWSVGCFSFCLSLVGFAIKNL